MAENQNILQVSEFLNLVNETLRLIPSREMFVEGEVSDFRIAQEKWVSFDLKDEKEQAVLKCFMTTWQLKVPVEDGMRVQISGSPKIYERFGTFKMNVTDVQPVGEGALRRAYELLKIKLQEEGLFEMSRKRSLKRFPERIGLITSRDAAAFGDFVRILNNRWGGIKVDHAHVHVQGQNAVREILGAFNHFNSLEEGERPDVIVLTRGGGGLEDLHAFNDEHVARAIFVSKIPVVCAVGHERDESLADFVADVRASTPSNAAEIIVPSRKDVLYEIETIRDHMIHKVMETIEDHKFEIDRATQIIELILNRQKERLANIDEKLREMAEGWVPSIKEKLEFFSKILKQVDPKRVLSRGYSIVTVGKKVITNATKLEVGTTIGVQLATGKIQADVKKINDKGQQQLV
jgi:exodeoxyribonuclease VII large subunit